MKISHTMSTVKTNRFMRVKRQSLKIKKHFESIVYNVLTVKEFW